MEAASKRGCLLRRQADAENDGELGLKRLAQIGIAAGKIALQEQEALDT